MLWLGTVFQNFKKKDNWWLYFQLQREITNPTVYVYRYCAFNDLWIPDITMHWNTTLKPCLIKAISRQYLQRFSTFLRCWCCSKFLACRKVMVLRIASSKLTNWHNSIPSTSYRSHQHSMYYLSGITCSDQAMTTTNDLINEGLIVKWCIGDWTMVYWWTRKYLL